MKIKIEVLQIYILIKVHLISDACKNFGEFLYISNSLANSGPSQLFTCKVLTGWKRVQKKGGRLNWVQHSCSLLILTTFEKCQKLRI